MTVEWQTVFGDDCLRQFIVGMRQSVNRLAELW